MVSMMYMVFAAIMFGFASCEFHEQTNGTLMETVEEFAEDFREAMINVSKTRGDIPFEWEDAMDIVEGRDQNNSTEFLGIDADGCDRGLRKQMEEKCDNLYETVSEEAHDIEDENEKIEALCCAVEDYEKCSLRAYDKANCQTDKAAIRENLKAARLFISVVANVSCTQFRGRCAYYSSAVSTYATSYTAMIFYVLFYLGVVLV